jgi:phosphate transport system permease protein
MATVDLSAGSAGILDKRRGDVAGMAFLLAILLCLVTCFAFLAALLGDVIGKSTDVFSERGADFVTSDLSNFTDRTGINQGIVGSLLLGAFVLMIAVPLGVATAVYLEEYAPDTRVSRLVRLNIRNLAGVPSVVYGLLGLAVFVELLGNDRAGNGLTGGRSLISGGLTLAVLVLPIVVITSSEAIRAVPQSLREGALGIGATRWDVVRTLVLPQSAPGILTGTILSVSRAIGETAPLILTGAFFGTYFSTSPDTIGEALRGDYTALPMIIYNWAGEAKPEYRKELAPAAIIVLLGITLLLNSVAVLLRNRYEKRRMA